MSQPKQIGILLIATRKYKQFVNQLIKSLDENFLPEHKLSVHLFTDSIEYPYVIGYERTGIVIHPIPDYGFPEATLRRYEIFTSIEYNLDYLYYLDVDMKISLPVGNEILGEVVAVQHPGYYYLGGGSWSNNKASTAYVVPEKRLTYYAGGFQGGKKDFYYHAMMAMRDNIQRDKDNDVLAEWHDESHWNKFLSKYRGGGLIELSPSYCMVEQIELRRQWKIDNLPARIIALEKNHEEIRS